VGLVRTSHGYGKLAVESAALGLGFAALLIWIGSALNGSFGYDDAYPYWPTFSGLRTDTAGAISFAFAIVFLVLSKYLQLRRRTAPVRPVARGAGVLTVQAMAETGVVLGTALVLYLSLNEVSHPWTLRMQLTHLASWPTEGTVRVIGLAVCLVGLAITRYLRATAVPARRAAPPPAWENGDSRAEQGPAESRGEQTGRGFEPQFSSPRTPSDGASRA
jgi:hypothetical protein